MSPRTRRPRRYVIVSVHDLSWGRTAIALSIADSLRAAGSQVSFVVHETNESMLKGKGYDIRVVGNGLGPLLAFALQDAIAEFGPDALILCDYFATCNLLHRMGIEDLEFLFDRPVISLDLWDSDRTGFEIDRPPHDRCPLCLIASEKCRSLFLEKCLRVTPVPIAPLRGLTARVRLLSCDRVPGQMPDADRRNGTAVVLTTTGEWQQSHPRDDEVRRLAEAVPRLLARHLAAVRPRVRWVHVGPKPFDVGDELEDRYEWLGHVSPSALDDLFVSCDLVISANASATTTLRAVAAGKPVILAQNSYVIGQSDTASDAGLDASVWLRGWIERARPVRTFRLWPLGYHRFLAPLVENNPYFEAVTPTEILREDVFVDTCNRLLFDRSAREASSAAQRAYVAALGLVPGPAEVIDALL
jgi:hypothetical protein